MTLALILAALVILCCCPGLRRAVFVTLAIVAGFLPTALSRFQTQVVAGFLVYVALTLRAGVLIYELKGTRR